MLLDDLATLIQGAGLGTVGTDLFKSLLPDSPDAAIGLVETGGLTPQYSHDSPSIALEQPTVQVRVRGTVGGYAAARLTMERLYQLCTQQLGATLGTTYYRDILALQAPFFLGPDEQNRPVLVVNLMATKRLSTV